MEIAGITAEPPDASRVCQFCNGIFKSERGVKTHYHNCKERSKVKTTTPKQQTTPTTDANQSGPSITTRSNYEVKGDEINHAYEKTVYWRKNLFTLQTGKVGKLFITEMTQLIETWCEKNEWTECAIKALMIMPNLLLQKSSTSKNTKYTSKINKEHLARRLDLWQKGKIEALLAEAQAIQERLPNYKPNNQSNEDVSRRFRNLIGSGNIRGAMRLLGETSKGVLQINEETLKQLNQKHPKAEEKHENLLIEGLRQEVNPIIFYEIDGSLIARMSIKTQGAAGPSNFDADAWKRVLGSKLYGNESVDLCNAIARMAKVLCTELVENRESVAALLACSLIPT